MDNFPLTPFLEQLATAGLQITVQDYWRINRVLSSRGVWSRSRLQTVLSSLLTNNSEQQELFNEQFNHYFKIQDSIATEIDVKQWNQELSLLLEKLDSPTQAKYPQPFIKQTKTNTRSPSWSLPNAGRKPLLIALALTILITLAFTVCQLSTFCTQKNDVVEPPVTPEVVPEPKTAQPEVQQTPKKETVTIKTTSIAQQAPTLLSRYQRYWHWLFIPSSLLSLLLFALWWHKRRPPKIQTHLVDPTLPEKHFDESKIGSELPPILSEHERDQLADLISYTQSERDSKRLDINASIKASSKAGGISQIRFHKHKQLQGVLILDDANAVQRHWNTIAREWAESLKARGVPCTYGTYHDTPEQFITDDGDVQHLEDWDDKKHHLVFCIFADTHQATSLKNFDWQYWDNTSLLSYQENRYWDEREAQLQAMGVTLFSALTQGLFDVLQQQTGSNAKPPKNIHRLNTYISRFTQELNESDFSYLQRNLGANLAWAEACCLYTGAFSFAAAESIRKKHFPEIDFLQIQRFIQLNGTWTDGKRIEFSPRLLIALRQRFAQRDKHWQQQIINTWQQLLDDAEPQDKKSLGWQIWAWKKYRLLMQWDSDTAAQKLHELIQSYPRLKASIQAELNMASLAEADNKIPLPTPNTATGKKHLYALAKMLGNNMGISQQAAYPQSRLQMLMGLLLTSVAIASAIAGNWQMAAPEEDNKIVFEMVTIPKGEFKMGCVSGIDCNSSEKPIHDVSIPAFMISATEVTNQQYVGFLNGVDQVDKKWLDTKSYDDTSHIIKNAGQYKVEENYTDHPVINVSWYGAKAYLAWLSEKTGHDYRLPSEAEWEYAARASDPKSEPTAYWWGNDVSHDRANYADVGIGGATGEKDKWLKTAPVAQFKANPWGLYDTAGNVWEWVEDCWHNDYKQAPNDGSAWQESCSIIDLRVLRGGAWNYLPSALRSANRFSGVAGLRVYNVGFRAARTLKAPILIKNQPKMLSIQGGEFQMGCVSGKDCNSDEKPVHKVTIKPFMLSQTEITNEQYIEFLNSVKKRGTEEKPWFKTKAEDGRSRIIENKGKYSIEKGYAKHPVNNVSWYGAKAYLAWLSKVTGHQYRLPSEAEWEYAARAGTATPYATGECINTDQANYDGSYGWENCPKTDVYRADTMPVASFDPNAWGLYDMHGNLWEWNEDCWHNDYQEAPNDGSVWQDGCSNNSRVLRGGSWINYPNSLRSAGRLNSGAGGRSSDVGFRAARTQ